MTDEGDAAARAQARKHAIELVGAIAESLEQETGRLRAEGRAADALDLVEAVRVLLAEQLEQVTKMRSTALVFCQEETGWDSIKLAARLGLPVEEDRERHSARIRQLLKKGREDLERVPANKGGRPALYDDVLTPEFLFDQLADGRTYKQIAETAVMTLALTADAGGKAPGRLNAAAVSRYVARHRLNAALIREGATSPDPERLAALAREPDFFVRRAVAGNQSTPPRVLKELATDGDERVRQAAGGNPSTPAAGRAAAGLLAD